LDPRGHALREAVVVNDTKGCSCVWGTQPLTCVLQGLADLKDHNGWVVSRDDDLQVMYRHHAGVCGLWMSPGDICHITHQLSLSQALQRMPQTPSALMLV